MSMKAQREILMAIFFQDACSHDPKCWLFCVNTSWYVSRGNLIWPIRSARRALKELGCMYLGSSGGGHLPEKWP